ncbi:hypothetical protein [Mycobacterium kubicae]|uniref:hypothetical protein n=1 Tax=Mycobacterium kubicae TaxID=120959 RepID=UPI0007FFE9E3|nr:hypothetical protein [Mycobacterium kubicae]OBK50923.1 hypothetical protein A5657_18995 [Mycobacterium kubicae]
MARYDAPDAGANGPLYGQYEQEPEPTPGWRKPLALVGWGLLIAVLIGLIIYGIILLSQGPAPTPTTTTATPTTTASTTTTPTTTSSTTTSTTTTTTTTPTTTTPTTTNSRGEGALPRLPSQITLPLIPTVINLPPGR